MSTVLTLTYCGMEGTGRGVKSAKADAARKIESLVDDLGRHPHLTILEVDGHSALVARTKDGWGHVLLAEPAHPLKARSLYVSGFALDSDDALKRCAIHLMQNAWSLAVEDDVAWIEAKLNALPKPCRDRSVQADLRSYFAWQRSYARLRTEGLTDEQARDRLMGRTRPVDAEVQKEVA